MYTQIFDWIVNIGLLFLIASVIVWGRYYKTLPKAIQVLGYYLVSNLFIQLAAHFLWYKSLNNLPLLHLNTILEFVFISLFFKEMYIDQHFFKKNIRYIISGGVFLLIINSLFWEPINDFNSNAKTLVQVIIIAHAVAYFFDAFGRIDFSEQQNQAISFICFAILLNYSGSLFIFMFSQFFPGDKNLTFEAFWIVNACLTFVFQLIILIAISRVAFQGRKLSVSRFKKQN